jgi:hypothetical protein
LKQFWPGCEAERDEVTDAGSSFTFTGPGILQEIEEQRSSSSALQPTNVLRRTKGQLVDRIRPFLTRINTSDISDAMPQADSVPRISSATSHGSIDIPDVEDLVELPFEGRERSPKFTSDSLGDPFPSLANLYLDESIRPLPSAVLYEAVPLLVPQPFSEVSSRLPSSEATSMYSSDDYFSSTDSLGEIAASTSTTPLAGLRTFGRAQSKNKQGRYVPKKKLFGWVGRLWKRGLGGLIS